jgi:NADH-quinone oxidoreductase subunit C
VIRLSSVDDTAAPANEGSETEAEAEVVEPDELRDGLVATFQAELGAAVVGTHLRPGNDLWVRVTREAWREAGFVARDKLGCKHFTFLSAIDWMPSPFGRSMDAEVDKLQASADDDESAEPAPIEPGYTGGDTRFQVFARVANITNDPQYYGVTLKVDIDEADPHLDTWIPVYAGADWHERETWEMYGITFDGHPYLRHIYLPSGFEGHPQRKDFPLLARLVKPWPGIVDVEPMPGEDEPAEGSASEGGASEGSSAESGAGEGGAS